MPILRNSHNIPAVPVASQVQDQNGKLTQEYIYFLRELADMATDIDDIEVLARQANLRPFSSTANGGGGGGLGPTGPAPDNVTITSVTGSVNPVSNLAVISVAVTPPSPIGTFIGCHLYCEVPDQSSQPAVVAGSTPVGSGAVTGRWSPIDIGEQVYVASQQPWTVQFPIPANLDASQPIPSRLYANSFSVDIENLLVQANQPSPTPNQTFTLQPGGDRGGAATNITGLKTVTGALVGLVVTVLAPVNDTGKLQTPFVAIVTDTPQGVDGWTYQLVMTYGGLEPNAPKNQQVVTGLETQAGIVTGGTTSGGVEYSFLLDTPKIVTYATVWLQAGLVEDGKFKGNNIVPGITPSFPVTFGSTVGTTDAAAIMTSSINSSMAIVSGLFGVADAGITNALLGPGAVGTINIQNLAVTQPLLAAAAVAASNLASGSVTNDALAALAVATGNIQDSAITSVKIGAAAVTAAAIGVAAVGTAAIQNAAITNALIANAAIDVTKIIDATITGAKIANATIAGANIGTATIAQGNMANASIGTAQMIDASITDAKIINLSASKITAGTISATIQINAPSIVGGTISGATLNLNLNGVTSRIENFSSTSGGNVGLEVKNNSSGWWSRIPVARVQVSSNSGSDQPSAEMFATSGGGELTLYGGGSNALKALAIIEPSSSGGGKFQLNNMTGLSGTPVVVVDADASGGTAALTISGNGIEVFPSSGSLPVTDIQAGNITFENSSGTTLEFSATFQASGTVPTTATGFLSIVINSTTYKVPYF